MVAKDQAGIGMGPGQPNRVDAALLACERAEAACERMGIDSKNLVEKILYPAKWTKKSADKPA